MDYRKLILDYLLIKYENSAYFQRAPKIKKNLSFSFTKKTLPVYLSGNEPEVQEAVHQAVCELEGMGILGVEWVNQDKRELLKRVTLKVDKVAEAYQIVGQTSKQLELEEIGNCIRFYVQRITTPWISAYLDNCLTEIIQKSIFPTLLPRDKRDLGWVLNALYGIAKMDSDEMTERCFSLKYLGDSNLFSHKARAAVVNIARIWRFDNMDLTDEEVLNELGIVKAVGEITVSGPVSIGIRGRKTTITPISYNVVIDPKKVQEVVFLRTSAQNVVLVENKANFYYLARIKWSGRTLLIHLGGYPGPKKREILSKISELFSLREQRIKFYYWGDIDFESIRTYQFIQERVFPDLLPLYMDEQTLLTHQDWGEPLDSIDRGRLFKLSQAPKYQDFNGLLALMLDYNIRLEQEILLVDERFCFQLPPDE